MKKLFGGLLTSVSILFASPTIVYAANSLCPAGFTSLCNLDPNKNPNAMSNVVTSIVTILIIIAAILSLFYLVYGGIKWITSGGDKAKLDAARSHLTAAVIGLVIALLALFIVGLFLGFFGIDIKNLSLPTLV